MEALPLLLGTREREKVNNDFGGRLLSGGLYALQGCRPDAGTAGGECFIKETDVGHSSSPDGLM